MKMMRKTSLSDRLKAESYARRQGLRKRWDFVDFDIIVIAFMAGMRAARREKDGKV